MSTHAVSRKIPRIIHPRRYARNGELVKAAVGGQLADSLNHTLAYRRKCVMAWSQDWTSIPGGVFGPADWVHGAFYAGVGADKVRFLIGMVPDDSGLGADPEVYIKLGEVGMSLSTSDSLHYGLSDGGTVNELGDLYRGEIDISVTEGTVYEWKLVVEDYARPVFCCAYEIAGSPVDTADGAVEPTMYVNTPITSTQHQDMLELADEMHRKNGTQLIAFTQPSNTAVVYEGNSYQNILDTSIGSHSSTSPGWTIDLSRHRTVNDFKAKCWFGVRADARDDDATVRLTNGLSNFDLTLVSAAGLSWQYTTVDLPAGQHKWDVLVKSDSGDTEFDDVQLDAVALFAYDP